jgi:uncharacterized ferritin-like protein (DUF455 family)
MAAFARGLYVLRCVAVAEKLNSLRGLLGLVNAGASITAADPPKGLAQLDEVEPALPPGLVLFDPRDRKARPPLEKKWGPIVQTLAGLAHIELSATHMWLETALRFQPAPPEFAKDCIQLANDEATHFEWLCDRMRRGHHGVEYGDLPAHSGLWNDAVKSKHCILHRLAVLALVQEARALDVHARLVNRLKSSNDAESAAVADAICKEEVRHVAVGLKWFSYFGKKAVRSHEEASWRKHCGGSCPSRSQ